jgi:hypothetical protein
MNKMSFEIKLAMMLFCLGGAFPALGDSLAIYNYDKDSTLSLAMECDSGETTDRSKIDRAKAEAHYLEYLSKNIPSFQAARVNLRLGALYTVESDPRGGIMPDYEKGQKYLEKVLELEPERIDLTTIRARTLLASSPIFSEEDRIRKRLDLYEWLSSLDNTKYHKLWLPLKPDEDAIRPIVLKKLQGLVPKLKVVEAMNIVSSVSSSSNREVLLTKIINRFPGEKISELARQEIDSQGDDLSDKVITWLDGARDSSNTTKPNTQDKLTSSVIANKEDSFSIPEEIVHNERIQAMELLLSANSTWLKFSRPKSLSQSRTYIPLNCWHKTIMELNPLYVYQHRHNIVVVLRRVNDIEEGKYICVSHSSYLPTSGDDGFELSPNPMKGNKHTLRKGLFAFKRNRSKVQDIQPIN